MSGVVLAARLEPLVSLFSVLFLPPFPVCLVVGLVLLLVVLASFFLSVRSGSSGGRSGRSGSSGSSG